MMRITFRETISKTVSSLSGRGLWGMVVLMATAGTLLAQVDAATLIQDFADNNRKLRDYSWTLRAEFTEGGETKAGLYKMRFDLDGNLQRTPISAGIPGEELPDEILDLTRLVLSYAQPRPNRLQNFLNYAAIWEGRRGDEGTIRVEGEGLNERGDSVTVLMLSDGLIPQEMKAETDYFGDKVYITSEYRSLSDQGPVYAARIVAQYPAKGIEMKLEFFDFISNPTAQTAPRSKLVPEGTVLQVRLSQPLSSKQNQTGQPFEAVLDEDIEVEGRSVVSRKTRVIGRLVEVKASGRGGQAKMVLTLTTLMVDNQEIPIETNLMVIETESTKGRKRKGVAKSVMKGVAIGGISDGGSGAARGAVISGSIGAAKALTTTGPEVEFQPDQLFAFHFAKPTEIPF